MQHLVKDDEGEKSFPAASAIYSCVTDKGKPVRIHMLTLGQNNEVILFPCIGCYMQMEAQILKSMFIEAMKGGKL